jgi:glutathione S-transferase
MIFVLIQAVRWYLGPMFGHRLLVHSAFLFLLPLIVASMGVSLTGAVALVVLALLWRWLISLSSIIVPATTPELELETISASHFVEKVRWCMDRAGLDYVEKPCAGTLGAFFLGRTVPLLKFRTGAVRSTIGNSAEILRYLWGRYAADDRYETAFLKADGRGLDMEAKIDRCGVNLQVWVYFHILDDKSLTLRAWGVHNPDIPLWQRWSMRLLFPLLRSLIRIAFKVSPARHASAVGHIDELLDEAERLLGDGRASLSGGTDPDFVDISFAAIMGLWLMPPEYGGGKAAAVRIEREQAPEKMRQEIERWSSRYPRSTAFIEGLYRQRLPESS